MICVTAELNYLMRPLVENESGPADALQHGSDTYSVTANSTAHAVLGARLAMDRVLLRDAPRLIPKIQDNFRLGRFEADQAPSASSTQACQLQIYMDSWSAAM